jgi:alpha-amylase
MFDNQPGGKNRMNTECRIYKEIARIAAQVRAQPPLRFGRMYFRQISGDGQSFGLPFGTSYTLAFSRLLYGSEVLFAYNVSNTTRTDFVVVDADLRPHESTMNVLCRTGIGPTTPITVRTASNGTRNVPLTLAPHEVMILG